MKLRRFSQTCGLLMLILTATLTNTPRGGGAVARAGACNAPANTAVLVTLTDHKMTGSVPANDCTTPPAKANFVSTDVEAYQWTLVSGANVGDLVRWEFVQPGGTIYFQTQYTLDLSGNVCFWASILIAGRQAATLPGNWQTRVFYNGTLLTTDNFTIGSAPPPTGDEVRLQLDDNTFEDSLGFQNGAATAYFLNRITPPSYPASLRSVAIFFGNRSSGLPLNTPIIILAGANPGGGSNLNGISLQSVSSFVGALGIVNIYDLPTPLTINSGDFVIGFRANNPLNIFPAEQDKTAPSLGRSYISTDGANFSIVDSFGATLAGNFGIRAFVSLGQLAPFVDFNAFSPGNQASTALAGAGINISSGTLRVESTTADLVLPTGLNKVGFFNGPGFSGTTGRHCAQFTFTDQTINLFMVTRPGVVNGASFPAWRMRALNSAGAQVGNAIGEGNADTGGTLFDDAPRDFTINGGSSSAGISRIEICSNNQSSTFPAVPLARLRRAPGASTTPTPTPTPTPPPGQCLTPPPGMVAWLPGDGNANDIRGSNNGSLRNGATANATGKVGQAFGLNGVDQFVEVPDAASLKPANVTVDAWVKFDALDTPNAAAAGLQYIVFKRNTRATNFEGYSLHKLRVGVIDRFQFGITSAGGTQVFTTSTTAVAAGAFYHVAGAFDGTTVKLYVNGVLEDQKPASFALDYGTRPLFIGTSGESIFDGKLKGVIDEIEIFNRALAASEIQAIFAADSAGKCKTTSNNCPTASSINPASGPIGGTVTITGTNFTGVTAVRFANNVAAQFTVNSDTQITATVPSGAVTGAITLSKANCPDAQTTPFTVTTTGGGCSVKADYQFQNSLSSSVGAPPALTNLGAGNSFGTATVDGTSRTVLRFSKGNGLALAPTTGVIANNTYSIVILFRFTEQDHNRAIVDFKNGTDGRGVYADGGNNLNFINSFNNGPGISSGSGSPFVANTYVQVVLTRVGSDANLGRAGVDTGYVNGVRQYQLNNVNADGIIEAQFNTLRFFLNLVGGSQDFSGGEVARIRLYDCALSASEVAGLDRLPGQTGGTCPTISNINPASAAAGSSVTITGTNFTSVTAVKFTNNVAATFTVVNDTTITATVPNGAVTGAITLSKPNCADVSTTAFTVTAPPACPTITNVSPSSGAVGASVIITGTNFTGVTALRFANNVAATFTINSATQISATVPNSAVTGSITISKPNCVDAQSPTPFTVTQAGPCLAVSISSTLMGGAGSTLTVPLTVSDTSGRGVLAYDAIITYDPTVLRVQNPAATNSGTLSGGMTITTNTATSGQVRISAFGANALNGAGTLLNLQFDVIGATSACSNLSFTSFRFNEGTPCATTTNGRACVTGGSLAGTVSYCIQAKPVPGVAINVTGAATTSNTTGSNGNFQFNNLSGGPYTLTPAKTGDANGISSFDAALVAQQVVDLTTLTDCQKTAGDASNNGSLSSFDAALIAQFVVGINNPQNTAGTWKFTPPTRGYQTLSGDQSNQDFSAVLVGDVSGNWTPGGAALAADVGAHLSVRPGINAGQTRRSAPTIPAQQAAITLPTLTAAPGASMTVPITTGDLTGKGVIAYDFDLVFDQSVLQLQSAPFDAAGTLSGAMTITSNATPGRLRLSAFGTQALAGAGTLLNLKFTVTGTGGTTLTWQRFLLNETAQSSLTNGRVNIARAVASVSAASFTAQTLAPESIVAAFGDGLATSIVAANETPLPSTLAGTTVRVRDSAGTERLAPLFFVAPAQINYLIPLGTAAGTATITVTSGAGTVSSGNVTIAAVAPGLFTANANGQGVAAAVALRVKADGAQSYELLARFDAALNRFVSLPIELGPPGEQVFLILFGTGLRGLNSLTAATALIGGADAPVSFVGAVSGLAGLDQVNLAMPRNLSGRGEVDLVLMVDGKAANTVKVNIK